MKFPKFALNRIVAPKLSFDDYLKLCASLNIDAIELRNDLPGIDIFDKSEHSFIVAKCQQHKIDILTINALYPFDVWNTEREQQAVKLAQVATNIKAKAIVCCPLNDNADSRTSQERKQDLRQALKNLKNICNHHGLMAYIEPLGFPQSALRAKKEAVEAIRDIGGVGTFKLVHDTFHHHLAEETEFFPELTGIVHVSGVVDQDLDISEMLDAHRILVNQQDMLENIAQLKRFKELGYTGYVSYEPFAESVHNMQDIENELKESMNFIRNHI
ncbi:Predicted sugar epimerase [Commensalibacter communis]|uniref:TIM barrel protein n=1 Tax=Commensalibacter communis TaxID=2972786 RepID=UPI0022FF6576|nr:TIM barrel protein [Commensalibacter communis]CAI3923914.1 Predicted sugar epimerase [Commensalibacter communis]CAI3923944.1 Predicted sugar epimerase [Commensalibacter communis]CAI3930749.1 Predicted sugar epimerase [Commensalibacter communis]